MLCFKNVDIYIEGEGVRRADLAFDGVTRGFAADGDAVALPSGALVVPAFIDEHIHGAAGADFTDGGGAAKVISAALPEEGTGYYLATTMTVARGELISALKDFGGFCAAGTFAGAKPLGVHLEGPFISAKHIGAQNPEGRFSPDVPYFKELFKACGGRVKMMTLAPEEEGADELIRAANDSGVIVSAGHTDATAEQLRHSGISCATHLFNAMRGIHHREIGTAGGALADDGVYVELIADGVHVCPSALSLVKKIKPADKIIFITDAIRAKGVGDGASSLGGQDVFVKDGEARLNDGTLAGSVLKMNVAFKNAVQSMGASVTEASDYCSANPARHLGLFDRIGGIRVGKAASYTVLDRSYEVVMTVVDGNIVYKA